MTMTLISTVTVGSGGASTIDFTSIPQTYTDLQLVLSLRSSTSDAGGGVNTQIKPNGATSGFTIRDLYGTGSGVGSGSGSTKLFLAFSNPSNFTSNTFSSSVVYMPNYAGSTYKSFSGDEVAENNGSTGYQGIAAGLWSNTAAITSLSILLDTGNLVEYSTASLYGILKGSGGATVS